MIFNCVFVTFLCVSWVRCNWIVAIPDLCRLSYFLQFYIFYIIDKINSQNLDPESFFQSGSNFNYLFRIDEGREDQNITLSGQSLARQQIAIKMGFRWQADGGPTLNAGLVALYIYRVYGPVLLRKPNFFFTFGRGVGSPVPLLDPRMYKI